MSTFIVQHHFALSSGEKQAVAVASVYAFAPSVIVMDEPSANLDPMATQKLREIIQALRTDGFTIVISEHRIQWYSFVQAHLSENRSGDELR